MIKKIKVEDRFIGDNEPCFIIAELGINHNGNITIAKKLIDEAKKAGADAVKFQTFKTENLLSKNIIIPEHVKSPDSLFEMIKALELSKDDHYELAKYCKKKKIIFMSTAIDKGSVDLLDEMDVPAFKVASCDLDNLPLLKYIAKKGKPIILSTGMGTIAEVGTAVETIQRAGNKKIILLHCVSLYPPKIELVNLEAMLTLKNAFKLPVGYSDHTIGINISLAAVAMGATVIEKHFTLDKKLEGADHLISADPSDLTNLISGTREIEIAMGDGIKKPQKDEIEMKKSFRRSIVASVDIKKGEVITAGKLALKRPGTGLSPTFINLVVGRKAKRNIKYDDLIDLDDF